MSQENSVGEDTCSSTSPQEISSEPELSWQPLVLTNDVITDLWGKLQEFPQVFDDYSKGDFNAFVGQLLNPRNIFVDIGPGIGIAAGFGVRPGLDVQLHLVMFDRRLRGREGTFKQIMEYFYRALRLHRMTVIVAEDCKTAIKLTQRLGFVHEGTMRGAVMRDGSPIDAEIYGLLRSEFNVAISR